MLVLAAGVVAASCGGADRSDEAEDLRAALDELPGVTEATVSYTPRTLELAESVRFTVIVEPAQGPEPACAVVSAFVERIADTGIDVDGAEVEVRDVGTPPLPWSFTAGADADGTTAAAECVASQQVRAVPIAYSAEGRASGDEPASRPRMVLRFRGGNGVESPGEGEALARTQMPAYDDFDWQVLVICGDTTC